MPKSNNLLVSGAMKLTPAVMQTIIDHLPCGVTLVDAKLNLIAYNGEFLRLLEFPASLVERSEPTFETFVRYNAERGEYGPGDPEELVRGIIERALRMESHLVERTRPNGKVIEIRGTPLPGGGFITVYIDVTERKRAHDELARSNTELEQFAYVASHDLQEPLRMVTSYTQLLQRRFGDRLDGDAKEFMAFIVDGSGRMKQLIEELLRYSRVGTQGKELRPVELDTALRRALANVRTALEESGATISYDPLPLVMGEEIQLTQLLQNLLGNALKFRSNSVPHIHIQCTDEDEAWHLEVRDNGIGIDPQYFERIFMIFQRLHDKSEYPGTGIGLAICKKIIERHGGRLWVESRPGEGSGFHFTLSKGGARTDRE